MKYNKRKAFTLAEVMVLLLTLSILLAAFAPVFTRRYVNTINEDVWSYVPRGSSRVDTKDIYYDTSDRSYAAQAYIGLTPKDTTDVDIMTTSADMGTDTTTKQNQALPTKVILAATDKKISDHQQNQIQFRSSDGVGTVLGSLFAGRGNLLLGGPYKDIEMSTEDSYGETIYHGYYNTAYGHGALTKLKKGSYNTAVGYNALHNLEKNDKNTAIGYDAGSARERDNAIHSNVFVGYKAGARIYSGEFNYNTLIGFQSGYSESSNPNTRIGYNTTAIGYKAFYNPDPNSNHRNYTNTVIGSEAYSTSIGSYNTAVGNKALYKSWGSFNTAVGAFAGYRDNNTKETNYKTFIGYNSGKGISDKLLFDNSKDIERVFIGTIPKQHVGSTAPGSVVAPGAVLEVHNIKTTNDNLKPMPGEGNSSVVINGNLIVRGNTYLEAPIVRQGSIVDFYAYNLGEHNDRDEEFIRNLRSDIINPNIYYPKGLVLFKLFSYNHKEHQSHDVYIPRNTMHIFGGFDGIQRSGYAYEHCDNDGYAHSDKHAYKSIRPNCICTAVRLIGGQDRFGDPKFQKTTQNGYDLVFTPGERGDIFPYQNYGRFEKLYGSNSYDWFSKTNPRYSFGTEGNWRNHNKLKIPVTTNGVFDYNQFAYAYEFGADEGWKNRNINFETIGQKYNFQPIGICGTYAKTNSENYTMGTYYSPSIKFYGSEGYAGQRPIGCTLYDDMSSKQPIILERRNGNLGTPYRGTDFSYAHLNYPPTYNTDINAYNAGAGYYNSCCPVLIDGAYKQDNNDYYKSKFDNDFGYLFLGPSDDFTHVQQYELNTQNYSDRRLKYVGEQFTAGLDEIKKLNVYNYTFKNDKNKLPQVGVIAQDLRLIFPKAVTQDEKGYYKIRWDEMFYAAINAIKTLNSKIESFVVKVEYNKQRIAQLKKDNIEMNNKLDELYKELARLEKLASRKNNK